MNTTAGQLATPDIRPLRWLATLLVLCLAGCATGPEVRSQRDPSANFANYQTFGFYDEVTGQAPAYSNFVSQYLKQAVTREMQARGFKPSSTPDLLVNFNVVTKDKLQVSQTPTGYYGFRRAYAWGGVGYETDVRSYTEGTLNVDVIDRKQMKLVWEGTAIGRIKDQALENPQPAVDQTIAKVFEQFPRPATSAGS